MADKQVRGDKFWRSAALLILCALVYYISYDQGREAVQGRLLEAEARLAAVEKQAAADLENQRREIIRLQSALTERNRQESGDAPSVDRLPLRVNQSRILFGGRLVVTLLRVDSENDLARIQVNFIEEEQLAAENLPAGGSLRFTMDGQNWALVVSALTLSTATLNLVELKSDDQ
ncbi:MAG: hypothetical protein LBV79_12145 [Candidatus Adiutrix sp.]|jgi:hypothetical protein|nr:hypothetical protein [Candidatus Adiutrix sp.]